MRQILDNIKLLQQPTMTSKRIWLLQRTLSLIKKWQLIQLAELEKMALVKHALEIELRKVGR